MCAGVGGALEMSALTLWGEVTIRRGTDEVLKFVFDPMNGGGGGVYWSVPQGEGIINDQCSTELTGVTVNCQTQPIDLVRAAVLRARGLK